MEKFITKKHDIMIKNLHFNDFYASIPGDYEFHVDLELSDFQIYISKQNNKLRFDIQTAVVTREKKTNHLGFTLDAFFQIVISLKKGTKKEDIESFIEETKSNSNLVYSILKPIVAKEINRILGNSKFRGSIAFSNN